MWAPVGTVSAGRRQALSQAATLQHTGRPWGCWQPPANTAPANAAALPSLCQPDGHAALQHRHPAGRCPPPACSWGHPGEPPPSTLAFLLPCVAQQAQGDPQVICPSSIPPPPPTPLSAGSERHQGEGPGGAGFHQENVRGSCTPCAFRHLIWLVKANKAAPQNVKHLGREYISLVALCLQRLRGSQLDLPPNSPKLAQHQP